MIRDVTLADVQSICDIYNYYIEKTVITFEEECVSADTMWKRIEETTAHYPWYVYELEQKVVGYAYAARWRERSAYRLTAETTVYLDSQVLGKKCGSRLYEKLIGAMREISLHDGDEKRTSAAGDWGRAPHSVHALVAGVALPNPASVAIHEKFGFKQVAEFKEVGWKFGRWIDVGYWELIL